MRNDEFRWKGHPELLVDGPVRWQSRSADSCISGLNDATSSNGRNLASKVVGDIIVCIETDPASHTARHPGDRFPEVVR